MQLRARKARKKEMKERRDIPPPPLFPSHILHFTTEYLGNYRILSFPRGLASSNRTFRAEQSTVLGRSIHLLFRTCTTCTERRTSNPISAVLYHLLSIDLLPSYVHRERTSDRYIIKTKKMSVIRPTLRAFRARVHTHTETHTHRAMRAEGPRVAVQRVARRPISGLSKSHTGSAGTGRTLLQLGGAVSMIVLKQKDIARCNKLPKGTSLLTSLFDPLLWRRPPPPSL